MEGGYYLWNDPRTDDDPYADTTSYSMIVFKLGLLYSEAQDLPDDGEVPHSKIDNPQCEGFQNPKEDNP